MARTAHGLAQGTVIAMRPCRPLAGIRALGRAAGAAAGAVAAGANLLPGAGTDALDLLETYHRRLQDLLKRGEKTTARAAQERAILLKTITDELDVHELIEDRVLYPALESHPEAKDIALEGFQEHHVANVIVDELHATSTTDERWGAKFKVFKENIEHHIEEEEGEMFRTARAVFSREQLQEMGARMGAMKAAMKANAQKN